MRRQANPVMRNLRTGVTLLFVAVTGNYLIKGAHQFHVGCVPDEKPMTYDNVLRQALGLRSYFSRDCIPGFKPRL